MASRRRYRWSQGQVVDFWDESFDGEIAHLALDDDSAFLAGLGASREPRMRDVLGTIAADQDAIIRADSHGALVVDGGPGTGKTVVALHRAAYLLYADPRLAGNRGELLVVGPHEEYLGYISDVLPSLGEDGVRTCTLHDLVPEGDGATNESDPVVAALKDGLDPIAMIERAVAFYEQPPTNTVEVETPWGETELTAPEWAEAFSTPEPGTSHHERANRYGTHSPTSSPTLSILVICPGSVERWPATTTSSPRSPRHGRFSTPPPWLAICGRCRRTCVWPRRS